MKYNDCLSSIIFCKNTFSGDRKLLILTESHTSMTLLGFSTISSDSNRLVGAATWEGSVTTRHIWDVPTVVLPQSRSVGQTLTVTLERGQSVSTLLTLSWNFQTRFDRMTF